MASVPALNEYSIIEHLARSIWLSRFTWGNFIAMISGPYTAYFDASGKKDQPVMTVCGLVSTVKRWKAFDAEWRSLLSAHSIDCFHMTDFVTGTKAYSEFRGDPKKQAIFLDGLIEALLKRTLYSFAVGIDMRFYRSANKVFTIDEFIGGPYAFAGLGAMIKLKKWATRNKATELEVFLKMVTKVRADCVRTSRHYFR